MDTAGRLDRNHDKGRRERRHEDGGVDDAALALSGDERRMHVRAYNHWVSLLKGRACPPIEELDPASIADFGPNSVLLDFTTGIEDPRIAFLGAALRDECELGHDIDRIAQVPPRSLLSRLTDHYLQIIANRAPIGFEAEFVGQRGRTTLYRGILMPFASDGDAIDYIYGVINWKEMVGEEQAAAIAAELDAAVRDTPPANDSVVWADGPGADVQSGLSDTLADAGEALAATSLEARLSMARESAAQVRASDARSRAALYRALARAHDFALAADAEPEAYAAILAEAELTVQTRAPMTPIAKLVFGADHDKTRLAEYAAVLAHARRAGIVAGALGGWLDAAEGGIKGVVAAERAARRPAPKPDRTPAIREQMRTRAPLAASDLAGAEGEFVVLLARGNAAGALDLVARIDQAGTVERVLRSAA